MENRLKRAIYSEFKQKKRKQRKDTRKSREQWRKQVEERTNRKKKITWSGGVRSEEFVISLHFRIERTVNTCRGSAAAPFAERNRSMKWSWNRH
jgi:hypothetical protein